MIKRNWNYVCVLQFFPLFSFSITVQAKYIQTFIYRLKWYTLFTNGKTRIVLYSQWIAFRGDIFWLEKTTILMM
jgi:hypothetical protein